MHRRAGAAPRASLSRRLPPRRTSLRPLEAAMRPLPRSLAVAPLALAALLVALAASPSRVAAQCMPGSCTGTFHLIDFESFAPGSVVEGLGAVDPVLNIQSVAWGLGP